MFNLRISWVDSPPRVLPNLFLEKHHQMYCHWCPVILISNKLSLDDLRGQIQCVHDLEYQKLRPGLPLRPLDLSPDSLKAHCPKMFSFLNSKGSRLNTVSNTCSWMSSLVSVLSVDAIQHSRHVHGGSMDVYNFWCSRSWTHWIWPLMSSKDNY